jgi:hypothetical protein
MRGQPPGRGPDIPREARSLGLPQATPGFMRHVLELPAATASRKAVPVSRRMIQRKNNY